MATPTLIDVSRGAIDVNLQTAIPGATVRSQLSGDLRTSYQAQWDTGQPGINLKNNSSWNFLGTNLSNSQITMFLLEGVTDYQKQQMVAWRDQCIDPDRDGTREFIFQITVNSTFASTGAWHGQSKYTCFARYFGSSDWNNRVDRIYFGLVNDSSIGGNAVTSTASSSISEMMTKIATGVVGNIRYSLSGISIWFDDQEDDTLGPPDETIHNFRSTFQQEVCLNDVDVVVESPRVLALLADADGNDCIIETTVPSGGGSGGTDIAIEEGGTQVVAAATVINFNGSDFDVTDNGSGEVTITTVGGGSSSGKFLDSFTVNTAAARSNSWLQTFDLNYDDSTTAVNTAFSLAAVARTHVRTDAQTTNTEVFDDLIFDDDHFTIVAGTQSNSFDRKIQIKGGLLEKFEHEQETAAQTWTINHGLSTRYPVITVYDSTNEVVLPMSITASSATQTTITFPVSVAGFATLVG